jgi:uncharacterized membrane protein YfcA
MNLILALTYFFIALIPSVIGAISGIGGGVLIKPTLDLLPGKSPQEISFLSGSTVFAMSATSLLRRKRTGITLEKIRGTALALGAGFGGITGKILFDFLIESVEKIAVIAIVQSLILIVLTAAVMVYTRIRANLVTKNIHHPAACAALGVGLGIVSAFLGIGGGPFNVMAISYLMSMDSKTTALHSLYIIFISQAASIIFAALSYKIPAISTVALIPLVLGGILGGILGSQIVKRIYNHQIDKLFFLVLVVVIVLSAHNLVKYYHVI